MRPYCREKIEQKNDRVNRNCREHRVANPIDKNGTQGNIVHEASATELAMEPERPKRNNIREETGKQSTFFTDDVDHIIIMINDEPNEEDLFNDEHDPYLEWDNETEFSIALTSEADKSFQPNYYFKKIKKRRNALKGHEGYQIS